MITRPTTVRKREHVDVKVQDPKVEKPALVVDKLGLLKEYERRWLVSSHITRYYFGIDVMR